MTDNIGFERFLRDPENAAMLAAYRELTPSTYGPFMALIALAFECGRSAGMNDALVALRKTA